MGASLRHLGLHHELAATEQGEGPAHGVALPVVIGGEELVLEDTLRLGEQKDDLRGPEGVATRHAAIEPLGGGVVIEEVGEDLLAVLVGAAWVGGAHHRQRHALALGIAPLTIEPDLRQLHAVGQRAAHLVEHEAPGLASGGAGGLGGDGGGAEGDGGGIGGGGEKGGAGSGGEAACRR